MGRFETYEEIWEYFKDKDVLVVGNGNQDVDVYYYDIVVRFGTGLNAGPCDIWVANFMTRGGTSIENGVFKRQNRGHSAKVDIMLHHFEHIIRFSQDQHNFPEEWRQYTFFVSRDHWQKIKNGIGYHQPLTGTMFLYWMIEWIHTYKSITVTGMDGFKTDNNHHNLGQAPVHNLKKDRPMLQQWKDDGKILEVS